MSDFSTGLKNSLLGGSWEKYLEECHTVFLSGDRSALMSALITCSLIEITIPDWVADELLTIDDQISSNKIDNMNEFFNFKPTHKKNLRKSALSIRIINKCLMRFLITGLMVKILLLLMV